MFKLTLPEQHGTPSDSNRKKAGLLKDILPRVLLAYPAGRWLFSLLLIKLKLNIYFKLQIHLSIELDYIA